MTPWRSMPQTKFFYSRTLDVAVFQVVTGLPCFWCFGPEEVFMIVDGGGGEGLVDRTPTEGALPCCIGVSPTLELQLHAGAVGEVGDCFGELQRLQVHYQLDGIPASLAVVGNAHFGQ